MLYSVKGTLLQVPESGQGNYTPVACVGKVVFWGAWVVERA
jgi:hypothetical protein